MGIINRSIPASCNALSVIPQPASKKRSAQRANVIVAAGPGGLAFDHTSIDKLMRTVKKSEGVTVKSSIAVGNGEKGISLDLIIEAVKQAKHKSRPISLFIRCHGRTERGELELRLNQLEWSSSRELFRRLKRTLGDHYPLSVFMTACHGGAAGIAAMDELPKGSVFVALGRRTDYVMGFDLDRFAGSIDLLPWNSSEKLLYHYLTKSLKNRITPVVACATKGFLDLGHLLVSQVGRSFSDKQQSQAHQKIDELIGKDYVDILMSKIQNARSEYDIYAVDYGPALAVVFASRDWGQA